MADTICVDISNMAWLYGGFPFLQELVRVYMHQGTDAKVGAIIRSVVGLPRKAGTLCEM